MKIKKKFNGKALVIIPARGGSKGLPNKNIKPLLGKPLIHYTIEAALAVFPSEDIWVSTDSPDIKLISEQTGLKVPKLRPDYLATDRSSTLDVIKYCITQYRIERGYEPYITIVMQVTSPLRTGIHLSEALSQYSNNIDLLVSVKETDANPYYVLFEENEEGFLEKSKKGNYVCRQDCPKVWEYNGAIYIYKTSSLDLKNKKIKKYVMPKDASIDIDDEIDFVLAETLLRIKNER